MRLPPPPVPAPLPRLSYSNYERGRACLARLAWTASGRVPRVPEFPGALLGSAFHFVVHQAHLGRLARAGVEPIDVARDLFDSAMHLEWQRAHSLVRLKYPRCDQLPFYNVRREEAASLGAELARSRPTRARRGYVSDTPRPRTSGGGAEQWLESADKTLYGRADYLDAANAAVVDYKTGGEPPASGPSGAEGRQLRFYACLALEQGIPVSTGVIVRNGGVRVKVPIAPAAAATEGQAARAVLTAYNAAVQQGKSFAELARPSSGTCARCECIPFCDAFWQRADPSWADVCGTHVAGTVRSIAIRSNMGVELAQLRVEAAAGTSDATEIVLEQVPTGWLDLEGTPAASLPSGEVRIIDARPMLHRPGVLRADKLGTAVWVR